MCYLVFSVTPEKEQNKNQAGCELISSNQDHNIQFYYRFTIAVEAGLDPKTKSLLMENPKMIIYNHNTKLPIHMKKKKMELQQLFSVANLY